MRAFRAVVLCAFACLTAISARAEESPVTVFAAASLKGVLDELVATGCCGAVRLSYAGSGILARQIAQGAPADAVILADRVWMDWLAGQGRIGPARDVAGNALVLVSAVPGAVTLGGDAVLARLGPGGRLAMGDPRLVPAGAYGQAALEGLGLWAAVQDRLALTDSVRGALAFAARGEVALAVVYASDVVASPDLFRVADLPLPEGAPPIRYPAALVAGADPRAAQVIAALLAPAGQALLERHGFGEIPQ